MRLRRLDLVRYGKFSDASLDFGPAPQRRPDFHIVYGPNEAGKSTAFAAFLDLLFGIDETRKPGYGFLHPPASLRIGAVLDLKEVGGQAQDLYGAAKGQVEDAADIASGAASDIYRNSGDYAQRGADAVTTTVKQYPLSALLLAAAVGFLAALLVASRN